MNCFIEVIRTESCIGCNKSIKEEEKAVPIRMRDNMGYTLSIICPTCIDTYSIYHNKKIFT